MPPHSRRGFLRDLLGPAWIGASVLEQAVFRAAQARAEAPSAPDDLFQLEKVADGVWAALARPAAPLNCNGAVFENAADVLVVDTHSSGSAAASLAAQVRKHITAKPVRYVVNTHFHWDHIQGAQAYRKLNPGLQIISSEATRKLMAELAAPRLKASLAEVAKSVERYKQLLAAATSAVDKARLERMVRQSEAYLAEMRNWTPELPSVTFSDHLVIHDRAHTLHLAFRGRGHTAGDVVIFCPEKKALASGDLLHGFLPYIGDGYPKEWPATLKACGEYDFQHVLGGHGPVQHSRERLPQMAAYITELTEAVSKGKQAGRTVGQLQGEIRPPSLKSLSGAYGNYVAANLKAAYGEAGLAGDPLELGLRENIASTFQALGRT
jgi:glyoxylase-like metal-dependent hydrolase (beta-lactamase superfamily II)